MKALLFDIDGTILRSHGAGKKSFMEAAEDVYGTAGEMETVDFQGKTDPLILFEALKPSGLDELSILRNLDEFKKIYFTHLSDNLEHFSPELLPGVRELLEETKSSPAFITGLLTGNFEISAGIKLNAFDLMSYFSFGAYGDDSHDRNSLPGIAREKLKNNFGHDIPFERMIIIGDTARDVECARLSGAVSLAVSTGWTDYHTLKKSEPDFILENLSDTAEVMRIFESI